MDREAFKQFKAVLLGIPGWNHGGARKTFLQDVFWGHELLNELNYEAPGGQAANDLIELLGGLDATDVGGLTPACALLKAIREKYGAGKQRESMLTYLERALCDSTARISSVLFLAAAPENQDPLRTDREFKEIKKALGDGDETRAIRLHPPELAVRPGDLSQALHRTQSNVVHFSGHGGGDDGIYFEDEQGNAKPVSAEALASVFRLFKHCVKVVVLNACFSEPQADAIADHIDYVIGTREDIGDETAIAFSIGFYRALAAGRSVEDAFQAGCAEIRMADIPEHAIPVLMTGPGKVTNCAD